ncbi:MAG TPA: penicillin-insensitive murein endopeptidase [Hyphomicrobiaceae bacterium]|nr:penicillin-insensitive murein endopeptidase [Hyphomicrobiaceae bacterium]
MRVPAFVVGLTALLAVPALLVAQDATDPAASDATPNVAGQAAPVQVARAETKPKKAAKAKPNKAAKPPPVPAKELFGAVTTPAPLAARSIGFYAKGCVAGAQALPVDGSAWQAMRLSRNRNWGHPNLIKLIERFAVDAKQKDGWPGLLVGDMSQPRGGPMLTGHASHQVGLDADVWFTPMPDHRLTGKEREELSAASMLAEDGVSVDPKVWSDTRVKLLKRAASYPQVERIFVHPAIKKAVCEATKDEKDRGWLSKVRPYWGHYYHFHIRIACPKGSTGCEAQPHVNAKDDGCGKELTTWLKRVKPPTAPPPKIAKPRRPKPPLTLAQLPAACQAVLASGAPPTADTPSTPAAEPASKAAAPASKPAPAVGVAKTSLPK